MEMAMATLIGTIFNRKKKCTYPCTPGPSGCFREIPNRQNRFLVVQTSGRVYLEQNLTLKLIQSVNPPENTQLADRFNKCLQIAFGETKKKPDVNELVKTIEKTFSKLEEDCRVLLGTAPEIAIVHPICKPIITSP